nr:MazG-like family protein [Liquorilactobacillus satsumensis]
MKYLDDHLKKAANREPKSIEQQFLKLTEEVGEAAQAYLSSKGISGNRYKGLNRNNVKEELVDVLLVNLALLIRVGGDRKRN